jgi:deazaflavin-dependent oxidoreductase (nitroreductase family)
MVAPARVADGDHTMFVSGNDGTAKEALSHDLLRGIASEPVCYLTTTGRVTGRPHTIEIWFALQGRTLYFLAGDGLHADWVRNIGRAPDVQIRVGRRILEGRGRIVTEPGEDAQARRLVYEKYASTYSGDLTEWRASATPVAVDLHIAKDEHAPGG